MTLQTDHDRSRPHRRPDDAPQSGSGIILPAVGLATLTAIVIWLVNTPSQVPQARPPAGPTTAARPGQQSSPAGVSAAGSLSAVQADPLPSWNDGPTKQAILDFVATVTQQGSNTFVPVPERVAVFDHDGTLVCEKPIVHGMFLLEQVRKRAERQPELADEEPFATLLTGDIDFIRRLGTKYLLDVTFTTLSGVTEEKLEAETQKFLATAKHPVFDVPFADVTYQPMQELLALLRSHDFSIWICSGSGAHFMRPAAEAWYGISPDHVIASQAVMEMREIDDGSAVDGSPNRRLDMVVIPQLHVLNDEERKPVSIAEHIGRRPIFAAGNVGSTGDIEMLRWSQSGSRPNLQLLVLHDDAEREMAYEEASNDSLEAAQEYGWNVVRMATDWKQVFSQSLEKKVAVPVTPSAPSEAPAAAAAMPPPVHWETEFAAFEQADSEQPPTPGGVIFLGSSNIRLWNTMAEDFAGLNPLNRGVAGSLLSELAAAAPRLVTATRPAAVVVSAGGNDIAAGATAADVRDVFVRLVENLRQDLPDVRIVFLAINPSFQRWEQRDRQQAANDAVREYVASQDENSGLLYINDSAALLGPDGQPAVECFLDDRLHPSTIGNSRRAAIIRPALEDWLQ